MRRRKTSPASAMTDIAFLLLLFFLIMAVTTRLTPIPLDRATSDTETQAGDDPVLIIGENGALYFEDRQVEVEAIPIEDEMTILADKDTPFCMISPILEYLEENGTKTIHCLVGRHP